MTLWWADVPDEQRLRSEGIIRRPWYGDHADRTQARLDGGDGCPAAVLAVMYDQTKYQPCVSPVRADGFCTRHGPRQKSKKWLPPAWEPSKVDPMEASTLNYELGLIRVLREMVAALG